MPLCCLWSSTESNSRNLGTIPPPSPALKDSPVCGVVVRRVPGRQGGDEPGDLCPDRLVEVLQRRRVVHREDQRDPEQHRRVLLRREEVHLLRQLEKGEVAGKKYLIWLKNMFCKIYLYNATERRARGALRYHG